MDAAACSVLPVLRSPRDVRRLHAIVPSIARSTDDTADHAGAPKTIHLVADTVLSYLGPDGKALVTVRYEADDDGVPRPVEIDYVLVSAQHRPGKAVEKRIRRDIVEHVLVPVLPPALYDERRLDDASFLLVNPTCRFVVGGPAADTGLTGRKDRGRHVRRRRSSRRRLVLRQGSDEGRPLRSLRCPARREERRRGGSR